VFGLDIPEAALREAFIMRTDISFMIGWETGRKSEPAFMDMNLHAVRGDSEPRVVLYQNDHENPMNPHGLLIAYAEDNVKPVVSDFDTFTVGSRGMSYVELPETPENQQQTLAKWAISKTVEILRNPGATSWNSRWLAVLREANAEGFHPFVPKYGFGDATSYRLIESVIRATHESGAVRHGSECFNFYFPQELDDDYLVIWEGFDDNLGKPWDYMAEDELRDFLEERIDEGYTFPMNPVWALRDCGWFELWDQMSESDACTQNMEAWYPGNIASLIREAHEEFPDGFECDHSEYPSEGRVRTEVRTSTVSDLDQSERADLVHSLAGLGRKSAWDAVRARFANLQKSV
jgi:hypothetical protein